MAATKCKLRLTDRLLFTKKKTKEKKMECKTEDQGSILLEWPLTAGPVDSASRRIRLPTLCASWGYCEDHGVTAGQVF